MKGGATLVGVAAAVFSLWSAAAFSQAATPAPQDDDGWLRRKLIDPEDGKLDASAFLESAYGFVPVATIITDPAVGYGGGLGLVFIQPDKDATGKFARPDITAVAGFATENGTWGAGAMDSRNWRDGRLKTLGGAFYASANLEFFGDPNGAAGDTPLKYNLLTYGAVAEARNKIGESQGWLGLRYIAAKVDTTFDMGNLVPGIDPRDYEQTLSGLTPLVSYDSRNNIFTPTEGTFAEASFAVFSESIGSDRDFEIATLTGIWYHPIGEKFNFGIKSDLSASFDGTPFYLRPYAQLRGLQSLRLQGENAFDLEAEVRWQGWTRWSLLAFAGGGSAWQGFTDFDRARSVATGGVGIRYLVARKFGLHMGFDIAFGPDDPIIYFQFGSAWFRP